MKLDGLTHLGFALFQSGTGRDHARQVRRVSAVVGGAIALDHDRILAHDSPLPGISLASIFVQPSLPQDTVSRLGVKIVTWLARDRYQTPLARVLVLAMASLLAIEVPSVPADESEDFGHLHTDQCGIGAHAARLTQPLAHGGLAEDLVHDLRAPGQGGHALIPVNKLSRCGLVVPAQQPHTLP